MLDCMFSEKQKEVLRRISPRLVDGTVETEWHVLYGDGYGHIVAIRGIKDNELREYVENHLTGMDLREFSDCGLFSLRGTGTQETYGLNRKQIVELVGSNFGEGDEKMSAPQPQPIDMKKVFVVHGRNKALRNALFDFLRSIELRPLEWSELVKRAGAGSPYVGQILDAAFSEAQAVVVLMTPDDEARLYPGFLESHDGPEEINLTRQARANVLFEAGMAMRRFPERTILVEIGQIRPFSDVKGRHTVRLDNSPAKRQDLASRLETAGCQVNTKGTDWYSTGNFDLPPMQPPLNPDFGKSGHIWWLMGDLIATRGRIISENKRLIDDGLVRCHYHASELRLTESGILRRLQEMMNEAAAFSEADWTRARRDDFLQRIDNIRVDAGLVVQSKEPDFRPNPPNP